MKITAKEIIFSEVTNTTWFFKDFEYTLETLILKSTF